MTSEPPVRRSRRLGRLGRLHAPTVLVLVVGVVITAGLATLSRVNYVRNEQRLVTAQTRLAALTLSAAPVDIQRRLGRAATVASATQDTEQFRQAISASVPAPFTSVLLYRLDDGGPQLVTQLGTATLLPLSSAQVSLMTAKAQQSTTLALSRWVAPGVQRLGYAVSSTGPKGTYVAYAEQVLPGDRRVALPRDSPLANVSFAIYLGTHPDAASLIETNSGHLPLTGTRATSTFQFGDTPLTLMVQQRGSLLGAFAQSVAVTIAGLGLLFTLGIALLSERLVRRRDQAEELAAENRRLYQDQRSVAETLQKSLLPQRLPDRPELALSVRYLAGTEGIDVGGDWYDVVEFGAGQAFFTVGDVSGRGLHAATMMASLRNAINAYAVEGADPAEVLTKVSRLVDLGRDGRFATVVCGQLDLASGRARIANAAHPQPVLVDPEGHRLLTTAVGPPLGVAGEYVSAPVTLAKGAVLLAYTDGLIERRGEAISVGQARLLGSVRADGSLDQMLDSVLAELIPSGPSDDVALLGMRWLG